jgi:hypothetical protein
LIAQTEGQRDADLNAGRALIAACLFCFSAGERAVVQIGLPLSAGLSRGRK